jgi:hypothetical protein
MSYAIMRCKKLSGMGSVAASLKHCYRERDTPNADQSRTPNNEHRASRTTDEAMGRFRALLPPKRRKDAVLAVEYVLTASPEWWQTATPEQQNEFFICARHWIEDKYGKRNVITATVHRDELSPHLSVFVVPLTHDGRLSARDFIGNRDKMSTDQTTFARCVADLGLSRGIEGSKAKHQRVKTFYAAIEKPEHKHGILSPASVCPQILAKTFLTTRTEIPEQTAARLNKTIHNHYEPAIQEAATARLDRRKAKENSVLVGQLRISLKTERKERELVEEARDYWRGRTEKLMSLTNELAAKLELLTFSERVELSKRAIKEPQEQQEAEHIESHSRGWRR